MVTKIKGVRLQRTLIMKRLIEVLLFLTLMAAILSCGVNRGYRNGYLYKDIKDVKTKFKSPLPFSGR